MKIKTFFTTLAMTFLVVTILPVNSEANRGGGGMSGQGGRRLNQTRSLERNTVCERFQNRTGNQDLQAGSVQKRGNAYGPGDGTGNRGDKPQDGTGYGAPTNR